MDILLSLSYGSLNCSEAKRLMDLNNLKQDIVTASHILHRQGIAAAFGHVSARVPGTDTFIFPPRMSPALVRKDNLLVLDVEGHQLSGDGRPNTEFWIHARIYKARPDVQAVVHVHPRFTTVLTVLEKRIVCMCNEGNRLVRNPLPVWRHQKLVINEEDGRDLASALGAHQAVLMFGHGATTTGKTVEEAVTSMLHLEHQAEMNYYAYAAAGMEHPYVPDRLIDEGAGSYGSMHQFGAQYELPHFKHAVQKSGMPKHNGVWGYWSQLVSREL